MENKHLIATRTSCSGYHQSLSFYRFRLRVLMWSFVAFLAVLFVAGCLIVQVFNSSTIFPKSYDLAEGDMRQIPVSTTFCEGISLHAAKLPRTMSIVRDVKVINEQPRAANVTLHVFISRGKYWYKAFYLLQGSQIEIEAQSEEFFQLLIFKGRSNFDGWIEKQHLQRESRINKKDNNKSTRISYVYRISQDENYYILFKRISNVVRVVNLYVTLSISRRTYDFSSTVFSCQAGIGKTCDARLLFNSKETAIVEVSARSNQYLYINNIPTTWNCQPRIWLFIVVFGGGYIACVTCCLIIYVLLMNTKTQELKSKARRQSIKSQSSLSGSCRENDGAMKRGSMRRKLTLEMSSQTLPSRAPRRNSSDRKRPVSTNGSLKHSKDTTLPSVVPHIYKGADSSDSEHETNDSFHHRVPSMENISLASFDTTVSLPVTFSTFNKRNTDGDTVSCHSFRHDASHPHRFRHRDRHHPSFYQELKRERDSLRDLDEAQGIDSLSSYQSDSQLCCARNMTLPARLSRDRRRDFYRDLELAAQKSESEQLLADSRDTTSDIDHTTLPGSTRESSTARKRDFYRDLDLAHNAERRIHPSIHHSDSQLDRKTRTLPTKSRAKRDFYRDLERDENYNYKRMSDGESPHGLGSAYEREFERVLERSDKKRLVSPQHTKHTLKDPHDSDQFSVGDQLDRIADVEDNKRRQTALPRPTQPLGNGCPPQKTPFIKAKPVKEQEKHLVVLEAKASPNGKVVNEKKKKKEKDSNKKDVKLRNHSNRRKDNGFWRPRLSIVSEV